MNDQDCLLPMIQHLIISSKYENIYKPDLNWVQPGREHITEENNKQNKQAEHDVQRHMQDISRKKKGILKKKARIVAEAMRAEQAKQARKNIGGMNAHRLFNPPRGFIYHG